MKPAIIVNFPPGITGEVKSQLTQSLNSKLEPITSEINSWNGFIELRKIEGEQFIPIAMCDNESLRIKMEDLLSN